MAGIRIGSLKCAALCNPKLKDTRKEILELHELAHGSAAPRNSPRDSVDQPLTPPRLSDPTDHSPLSPSSSSLRVRSPKGGPSLTAFAEEVPPTSTPRGLTVRIKAETTVDDGEPEEINSEEPAAMKKFTGIKGEPRLLPF